MRIRSGEFAYEDLLEMAEEQVARIDAAFATSSLPDAPDIGSLEAALIAIREEFYLTEHPFGP
jgi:hypothetical protein